MNKDVAATKADDIIKLLLANQSEIVGKYSLGNPDDAKNAAQAIAAFRKELIEQLEKQ